MGINSFGFGGANAHVIVEEYVPTKSKKPKSKKTNIEEKSVDQNHNKTHSPLFLSANNYCNWTHRQSWSYRLHTSSSKLRITDKAGGHLAAPTLCTTIIWVKQIIKI